MNRKDGKPKEKKFIICNKCNDSISSYGYKKHFNSCNGFNKNLRKTKNIYNLNSLNIKKLENEFYLCLECNKQYLKSGIGSHYWRLHTEDGKKFNPNKCYTKRNKVIWNKGLTKETDERIKKQNKTYKEKYNAGLIINANKGKKLTVKQKSLISRGMKKAHAEGRAWNIGKSRWNNKKSYPEEFFSKIIENEFQDKEYICEHPFFKYSIDFAWINKKLAIEIDGEQHERFEEYKARDKEKDRLLLLHGWKILRIKWKDMYNNTKMKIKEAYNFIHN
jgi:very-short-patch-repair endonuclease